MIGRKRQRVIGRKRQDGGGVIETEKETEERSVRKERVDKR